MKIFRGIPEVTKAVGSHLGYSHWHTITQQQIDTFAAATGDHQWIHFVPERAAATEFGGTIAHGYLTLALVPMLAGQVYGIERLSMSINYGVNKVRFPSPVPVGSAIRAGVELLSLVPRRDDYRLTAKVIIERAGSDKPACVAETVRVLVP